MLVSTPTKPFAHTSPTFNPTMNHSNGTPPRRFSNNFNSIDSPMLTPSSPLSPKPYSFGTRVFGSSDLDDLFLSPFKSPVPAQIPYTISKPQPITSDDDEGRVFASTSTRFPPLFSNSKAQPLITPAKQDKGRPALASRNMNTLPSAAAATKPTAPRTGGGTKRKSPVHCTPLKVDTGSSLHRLGPLSLPKFNAQTPESKNTDAVMKRHTVTLRKLRLDKPEAFGCDDDMDETDFEFDEDGAEALLLQKDKTRKGKGREEVAEAISPGGHIVKRRAKARPISSELRDGVVLKSPGSPSQVRMPRSPPHRRSDSRRKKPSHGHRHARPRLSSHITYPPSTSYRVRASPSSSSSEAGSPMPRRRTATAARRSRAMDPPPPPVPQPPLFSRPAFAHAPSAATLFFGPSIPQPNHSSSRGAEHESLSKSTSESRSSSTQDNSSSNRHSFAGSTGSFWSQIQPRAISPSWGAPSTRKDWADSDDEDMSFEGASFSSSFSNQSPSFIPSPISKHPLPSKYQVTSKEGGDATSMELPRRPYDSSGSDDSIVTPCVDWNAGPRWPQPFVQDPDDGVDVDDFILRTLAEAAKGPAPSTKKAPGTPVKKVRTLGLDRPWQTAAVDKIGLKDGCEASRNGPRKSLPAAFPGLNTSKRQGKSLLEQCSDSEGEEESPSGRKTGKCARTSLGLGHPPPPAGGSTVKGNAPLFLQRSRWLSRRTSSGQFSTISNSSDSSSAANTPTRGKGNGKSNWFLDL